MSENGLKVHETDALGFAPKEGRTNYNFLEMFGVTPEQIEQLEAMVVMARIGQKIWLSQAQLWSDPRSWSIWPI